MSRHGEPQRVSPDPGRAGQYEYRGAKIWISGPVGGTAWATIRFRSQEVDLDARSIDEVLDKAKNWIDSAPEMRWENVPDDYGRPYPRETHRSEDAMDEFTLAYFEAALWSTNDESDESGGEPLDANYSIDDFAPATRDWMIREAKAFQDQNWSSIEADNSPEIEEYGRWELAGHDFWFDRNGHGAGFEDGQWPTFGEQLAKAARRFGEVYLYVGDDGLIYAMGHEEPTNGAREGRYRPPPRRRGPFVDPRARARPGRHTTRKTRAEAQRRQPRMSRYDFFRKQGLGAQNAWDLAAAEQEAEIRGWEVTWEEDPEGWDSFGDIDPETVREVLWAAIRNTDGDVLASLGSIVNPDRAYGRLVEAELAFEALSQEGWKPRKRPR